MQAARPIRGPHGGWQKQEIDALRQSIEAAEQSGGRRSSGWSSRC